MFLGASAVGAAILSLAATSASADPWWGRADYAPGPGAYSTDSLFHREDRIAERIRRLSWEGRLNPWEARRAWRDLGEARGETLREAREHGRFLPPWDAQRIAFRLDRLNGFIAHEANDWD
jgi:hypothetical protein